MKLAQKNGRYMYSGPLPCKVQEIAEKRLGAFCKWLRLKLWGADMVATEVSSNLNLNLNLKVTKGKAHNCFEAFRHELQRHGRRSRG